MNPNRALALRSSRFILFASLPIGVATCVWLVHSRIPRVHGASGLSRMECDAGVAPVSSNFRMQDERRDDSAASLPAGNARAPAGEVGELAAPDDEHRVAGILARLYELARDPTTYHRRALPVIDELSRTCEGRLAADMDSGRPTVLDELMVSVVKEPGAPTLVRGAVFLALAAHLSESAFSETFVDWTFGDPGMPLELLRTAALAATRRGAPAPCRSPLSLERLAQLPVSEGTPMPGIYPLLLDRIAPTYACVALRRWLDADDSLRHWFRPSSDPPPADLDLSAAADYLVTVEVLICVWGHQSLVDSVIESAVVAEALMEGADQPDATFERVRAAQFVVHSLALCSSIFYDAGSRAASSGDRAVSGLARTMQRMAVGGIGNALVERIEGLRYSQGASDVGKLVLILRDVGENLGRADQGALEHQMALDYLEWLAADPGVDERARATALTAIVRSGAWEDVQRATKAALLRRDGETLGAVALTSLAAEAEKSPEQRAEVVALLREVLEKGVSSGLRSSVDQYLIELAQ